MWGFCSDWSFKRHFIHFAFLRRSYLFGEGPRNPSWVLCRQHTLKILLKISVVARLSWLLVASALLCKIQREADKASKGKKIKRKEEKIILFSCAMSLKCIIMIRSSGWNNLSWMHGYYTNRIQIYNTNISYKYINI